MSTDKIKKKLEKFQKKVLDQFEDYVLSIALLPPPSINDDMKLNEQDLAIMKQRIEELKSKHNLVVLINDSDSKEMSKAELATKLNGIISKIGTDIDPNFSVQTMLISDLWQSCMEGRREFIDLLAMSAVIYDKGILNAVKLTNLHKHFVTQKFEKYIVSYVLAGSLVTGKATQKSDIDIWIIVDDTDVKKMPRYELKEKLSVIIHQLSFEAAEKTGVKAPLNIQTYLLSDFWEGLRDANPIYFTLLRDGVPLYDRGMFVPWKQLLQKGKIKPSREATEVLMHGGQSFLDRIENKLRDIAVDDFFWAIHSPSQAALMLMGLTPPAPSETIKLMEEIFVKKEKLLEKEYLDILKKVLKLRKDIEHGEVKKVTGSQIEELLADCKKYLTRIKKLYEEIEKVKEKESVDHVIDTTISLARDSLTAIGHKKVSEKELLSKFEKELVESGQIKKNTFTKLKSILDSKKKLTTDEIAKIKKNFSEVFKTLIDFIEMKKGKNLDAIKINVKGKEKSGVINVLDNQIFILMFNSDSDQTVLQSKLKKDGSFDEPKEVKIEEYEKALDKFTPKEKPKVNKKFMDSAALVFGDDLEILI